MTGRGRVKATLTFSSPDRIPRDLWVLPYISLFRKTELEEIRIKFPADIDSPGSITPETEAIQRLATPGIYTDEWGSNKTLLVHPDMWRSIFKPLYREYCDIIHKRGKFVFFHSDGNIAAIIPDLIEIGVDALNAQLFCMDIEELGRKFKGRITFWGEIDRQYILPFGKPSEVRNAVQRVRRALGDEQGGVIGQCEWGKDVPKEHVEAVFESWL